VDDVTELLNKVCTGDPEAWDELYRRTEPELRKLAKHWISCRCARRQVQTTEVIHDALIKLIELMKSRSLEWPHRGAFYKFASRNILWALLRLLKRPRDSPNGAELANVPAPDRRRAEEALEALRKALEDLGRDLSEEHRAVVELHQVGEQTLDQIAGVLGISRYKAFRMNKIALAYLREKLAPGFSDLGQSPNRTDGG
jgi:RNA polymerase sigma factor (sigma-70 family)